MNPLDDLPQRDRNHALDDAAQAALETAVARCTPFILQHRDRKDYGSDYQLEVTSEGKATNVRIHVQLKGTEQASRIDGTVRVRVARNNVNYRLASPYSFYVCYHQPTDALFIRSVESVVQDHAQDSVHWSKQKTLTVTFFEPWSDEVLQRIASLALAAARDGRDNRLAQLTGGPGARLGEPSTGRTPIHVPPDRPTAESLLRSLYNDGNDRAISEAFDRFRAVLSPASDAMLYCFMAEANVASLGGRPDATRLEEGLAFIASTIESGRFKIGSTLYTRGNIYAALDRHDEAVNAFEAALVQLDVGQDSKLVAMCHKNLGSSLEQMGEEARAVTHYRMALDFNPVLSEAHFALGRAAMREGAFEEALDHFDSVSFGRGLEGASASLSGWRINVLFNLGDSRAAFREINQLLGRADVDRWVWHWCATQVASFGRASPENGGLAAAFWVRLLEQFPDNPDGVRELLLCQLYLRSTGRAIGHGYSDFRVCFEERIGLVEDDAAALLWSRLGQWAQDRDDWEGAEECSRRAFELGGDAYAYGLAAALNTQERFAESEALLRALVTRTEAGAPAWHQLAIALENLGYLDEADDAYRHALSLDPDHAMAWFGLAYLHWNREKFDAAVVLWTEAIRRFPGHALVPVVRRMVPNAFPH